MNKYLLGRERARGHQIGEPELAEAVGAPESAEAGLETRSTARLETLRGLFGVWGAVNESPP